MANDAGAYLHQAAQNLRNAAQAMQQQANELRRHIDQMDQDTRNQINEMEKAINNNNMFMARPNASDMERADRMRQNAKLDSDIVDRRHEFASIREQTNQRISNIERTAQNLNSQASGLDNQAGGVSNISI